MKPPLRCDRGSVDVLVETASAIETGVERTGAVAAGLRIASYVGAVIVARGVGRTDGVPLVSPDCAYCVTLGGNGDVVTEEWRPATAELLIIEVRRGVGHLHTRSPSLTAIARFRIADIKARRCMSSGAVTRRARRQLPIGAEAS